ncbi:MAG: MBL fold metallo-hydrolase [Halococcoides sp.]
MITNLTANVQAFTSNAFLVDGERTVLVDAGNDFDAVGAIEAQVETIDAVVLTHTHPDHVGTLPAVRSAFDPDVIAFDTSVEDLDRELADGDQVQIGDHAYRVLHTPGHKPDHVVLYAPDPGIAFAGDLVFANGGFGRTDLEGGDRARLIDSIEYFLETVSAGAFEAMHCGHGPSVTTDPRHDVELALQAARFR